MDDPTIQHWSTDNPPDPGQSPTTLFPTEDAPGTGKPGVVAAEHEQLPRPAAPSREQEHTRPEIHSANSPSGPACPAAPEQGARERQTTPSREPPEDVDLVTVDEAVTLFRERGLPRHIRTIQKYCARASGRALVCYQTPTENGIRYLIEKASIDRFIADAVNQAPTGQIETRNEPVISSRQNAETSKHSWSASDLGIYNHPYVKHLESRNDRLEDKNDRLQNEVKNVLEAANERLIELQKANAIAQSETLGAFLLEAERIRKSPDDDGAAHSPPSHPTSSSESTRTDI
jgi:hypothetical protein